MLLAALVGIFVLAALQKWHPSQADVYAESFTGVQLGVDARFFTSRTITDARVIFQGDSHPASLYDNHGDADVQDDPFELPAFHELLIESSVIPRCGESAGKPVFRITSESMGKRRVDVFAIWNTWEINAAITEWCQRGPEFTESQTHLDETTGAFEVVLRVTNPTSTPLTVTSGEVDTAKNHWNAATAKISPRSVGEITISGAGDLCDTPWSRGVLTAGGQPLPMSTEYAVSSDDACAEI